MIPIVRALGEGADRLIATLPVVSADVRAQRASLEDTGHRPWPLPPAPWMLGQTWHDLMFAHWKADPARLQRVVPGALPLDTYEGAAWIGITPFLVTGFRMLGTPPVPILSSFPELNVRTYVMVGGKPGIYFFSLDADSRPAVSGARRSHRLPYFRADMSVRRAAGHVQYESERTSADGPPACFEATYRQRGNTFVAQSGSLEHWLTERYCAYTVDEQGKVLRADIHHRPWKLSAAEADLRVNTMTASLGIELDGAPLLHMSSRQDTLLWALQPV